MIINVFKFKVFVIVKLSYFSFFLGIGNLKYIIFVSRFFGFNREKENKNKFMKIILVWLFLIVVFDIEYINNKIYIKRIDSIFFKGEERVEKGILFYFWFKLVL